MVYIVMLRINPHLSLSSYFSSLKQIHMHVYMFICTYLMMMIVRPTLLQYMCQI